MKITAQTTVREVQDHDEVIDILNEYVDLDEFHPGDTLKRVCKKAGMAFSELRNQLNEALDAEPDTWENDPWNDADDDDDDDDDDDWMSDD